MSDGDSRLAIPDLLAARAKLSPDQTALIVADVGELSFGEWDRRANAVANALVERGVPGPLAFVGELPKNHIGKVQKHRLRDLFQSPDDKR